MIELRRVESDADVAAYLEVRNRVEPADPVTAAGFRRNRERPGRLDLLALDDGSHAGTGFVAPSPEDAGSALGFAKAFVLLEHRRRGIGTRLLVELSRHARSAGRQGLLTETRETDRATLDYLGKRGFVQAFRAQQVALDVAAAEATRSEPPAGVELVSLADPDLEPLVYDAELEIVQDLPAIERVVTPPFDEWRALMFSDELLRACSFAALADGLVVGFGVLYARPYGAEHGLTGVRRAWRRRGVARAIKSAQIAAARAAGIAELRTANEVGNEPIRRLNESLGYRALVAWLTLRGPLIGP